MEASLRLTSPLGDWRWLVRDAWWRSTSMSRYEVRKLQGRVSRPSISGVGTCHGQLFTPHTLDLHHTLSRRHSEKTETTTYAPTTGDMSTPTRPTLTGSRSTPSNAAVSARSSTSRQGPPATPSKTANKTPNSRLGYPPTPQR